MSGETPIPTPLEFDIPFSASEKVGYFNEAIGVVGATQVIEASGHRVDHGSVDMNTTIAESASYLANPLAESLRAQTMTPAVANVVVELLGQYNYDILRHAASIRNMVVLQLLEETQNPRNKMLALQMLGKIPEVGLFVEKVLVPDTPKDSAEITTRLRERLHKYMTQNTISNAKVREVDPVSELDDLKDALR